MAFLPRDEHWLAPGHTLVVPRAHYGGVLDAPADVLAAVIQLVQKVGLAMREALEAGGAVVLNASGPSSPQSVPHLHFHVVPCGDDDEAEFWPADRSAHRLEGEPHELLAEVCRRRSS